MLCITNSDNKRTAGIPDRDAVALRTVRHRRAVPRVDIDTLTQFEFGDRVVVIDRVDEHSTVPSVTVDNRRGIELAFDHLRSLGHRRIGYVSGISGIHTAQERMDAYSELAEW